MEWRTDFDKMPRDGSSFLAWVVTGDQGWHGPEIVFWHVESKYDFETETITYDNDDGFWYTDAAYCGDGEHGSIGDSRIFDEMFIAWCPIIEPDIAKMWGRTVMDNQNVNGSVPKDSEAATPQTCAAEETEKEK